MHMERLGSLHCLGGTGVSPVQAQAEAWGYQILASDFSSVHYGRFDVPFGITRLNRRTRRGTAQPAWP